MSINTRADDGRRTVSHGSRYAVVSIANDKFIDYVIPFLESFRESNPDLRLIIIPFDEHFEKISFLSDVYNFELYRGSFQPIDELSRCLFGEEPYLKNRMRKLLAFELNLDEFLYIDTDIIVRHSFRPLFGHIQPWNVDLIYLSAAEAVYRRGAEKLMKANLSERFASCVFLSSARVTNLNDISRVMQESKDLFLQVRVNHLYDQPLMNFYFDVTGRRPFKAQALGISAVYLSVFSNPRLWLSSAPHQVDDVEDAVTLTHWSGPEKFREVLPLTSLLERYMRCAQERLASVPKLAGWRPFYDRSMF